MTSAQFITALLNRLGDSTVAGVIWPRTEIPDAAIRAVQKVAERVNPTAELGQPQTKDSTTIVADGSTTEFSLPSGCLQVLHVEIEDCIIMHENFRAIDQLDPNYVFDADWPVVYMRSTVATGTIADKLGILPAPATGTTVTIYYLAGPVTTTLAAALPYLPAPYHDSAVILAHWDLAHKNVTADKLIPIYNEYERSFIEAERYRHGFVDRFPAISGVMDEIEYEQDY